MGEQLRDKKEKVSGDPLNRGLSTLFPLKRFSNHPPVTPPPLTAVPSGSPAPCHFAAETPQGLGRGIRCLRRNRPELAGTFLCVSRPRLFSLRREIPSGEITHRARQLCQAAEGES